MSKEKENNFEESLKELEVIVKNLESGDIPLDNAISEFTKAMNLVKKCDDKLKNAEESLNKIVTEDNKLENFTINS